MSAICSRNTTSVERSTAARYVAAGQRRGAHPLEHRRTRVDHERDREAGERRVRAAVPEHAHEQHVRPRARRRSCRCRPSRGAGTSIGGNTKTNTADSRLRQKRRCCVRSSWSEQPQALRRPGRSRRRRGARGRGRATRSLRPGVVLVDERQVDVLEGRPAAPRAPPARAPPRPPRVVSSASTRVGSVVETTSSRPFSRYRISTSGVDADQLGRASRSAPAVPRGSPRRGRRAARPRRGSAS